MTVFRLAAALAALCVSGPASADPDALWPLLEEIRIVETEADGAWRADKTFPDALEALRGPVVVTGYPVVVLSEAEHSLFMLVRDREDCPFCGSGNGYGPSIEVELAQPTRVLEPGVRHVVTGALELVRDTDTYQAYRLVDARVAPE